MNLITSNIQIKVDAVNRAKDEAAYSIINLGKRLVELKEACPHGQFTQIAEQHCGLGERECRNLMRIYQTFGQNGNALPFSTRALLELTRSPDPESALEEAVTRREAGEDVTAQQAKEIARLHKEIESAKQAVAETEPSFERLDPGLLKLHKSGSLPERTALEFSKLDADIQTYVVLPKLQQLSQQQQEIARLKDEKIAAMEQANKERAEREALQTDYDAAIEKGTQEIIAAKDKEIQRKEKELGQLRVDLRAEIEVAIEKRVRGEFEDKLSNERQARERIERKLRQEEERARQLVDENRADRMKLEAAEEKLRAAHPVEKDGIHARAIGFITRDLSATIKKIESDCERHQRIMIDKALYQLLDMLQHYFSEQSFIEMRD